ncbi:MAG: LapA family protein [Deltaproteobacteria bacterium]|nr:LapA family protein [Deltaproteobacteria bacterium]
MKHIKLIIITLFLLLIIIVAVQNYAAFVTPVSFRLDLFFSRFQSVKMPISFVVVVAFLIGFVVAGGYGMFERFRLKKQIKTLTKEVKEMDNEINSLRNLPVTSEDMSLEQSSDNNPRPKVR